MGRVKITKKPKKPIGPVKCCEAFEIQPMDFIRPSQLTTAGRTFLQAHGFPLAPDAEDSEGLLLRARLLERSTAASDPACVKIVHRCDQLTAAGRCAIYADRPQICREFVCADPECVACYG